MEPKSATATRVRVINIMEEVARELLPSSDMKLILMALSPFLLQKLFGGVPVSEARTQICSFVEMYRAIFQPDRGVVVGVAVASNSSVLPQNSSSPSPSSSLFSPSVAFKVSLKMYRTELRKCFRYKGQSFQNFVTDEDLAAAHKDGVTKALSWLENQKDFQANNTNDISKELIRSSLEKEYRWLTEVNVDRFRKHVHSSFKDELEDGAFLLESSGFCYKSAPDGFGILPETEIQSLSEGIDKEIKSRVESFRKGVTGGGTINENYVKDNATTLSSKLEARGSALKNKNREFLATFATSYMRQVANEYNGRISSFLVNSNITVMELEESHQKCKGEALQKWESKILALDREFSTASQLVNLEGMLQESFTCIWMKRRETLVEQILEEQRKRDVNERIKCLQQAFGADAVEAFRANLPATLPHSPYEEMFRAAVESIKIGQQSMGGEIPFLELNSATITTTTSQTESTATQKKPSDDEIVGDSERLEQPSSSAAPKLRTKAAQPKKARLENVPATTSKNHQAPPKSPSSFVGGSNGRKRRSASGWSVLIPGGKIPCG